MYAIMSIAFIAAPAAHVKHLEIRLKGANYNNYRLMSFMPNDYNDDNAQKKFAVINGHKFYYYYPDIENSQLNGYYGFPGTETKYTLERIEMRGANLHDGFRVKKEYENIIYDFQGRLLDAGVF